MPPKNDILKDFYIGWTTPKGEVIGKVKSSTVSHDGFTCTVELNDLKKEKTMNEKMKDVNCVCIVKDGNEVKAIAMKNVNNVFLEGHNIYTDADSALSGTKIVATAKAKCGPNDIYDFNIGAKLAMDRLYEGYDMTPKSKRKPYNGLIYIHEYPGCGLAERALYKVIDGYITNCWYVPKEPYIFEDMSDKALTAVIKNEMYGGPYNVSAHFIRYDKTKA